MRNGESRRVNRVHTEFHILSCLGGFELVDNPIGLLGDIRAQNSEQVLVIRTVIPRPASQSTVDASYLTSP